MAAEKKIINPNFRNLKTQEKINNLGESVQELSSRSAGIVVVRNDKTTGQLQVLLMRAYDYWDFPKGKIEIGERVIDAAIRETREESGIQELDFIWGRDHTQTKPYGIVQKVSYYFIAKTSQERITMQINETLGRAEHEEYRWLSFKAAKLLASPRIQDVLIWAESKIKKLTPLEILDDPQVIKQKSKSGEHQKQKRSSTATAPSANTPRSVSIKLSLNPPKSLNKSGPVPHASISKSYQPNPQIRRTKVSESIELLGSKRRNSDNTMNANSASSPTTNTNTNKNKMK